MTKQSTTLSANVIQWRLKEVMQHRGIDYRELAEITGLHHTTVCTHKNLERMPSHLRDSTLASYCKALDCQPGDLLVSA